MGEVLFLNVLLNFSSKRSVIAPVKTNLLVHVDIDSDTSFVWQADKTKQVPQKQLQIKLRTGNEGCNKKK